LLGHLKGVEGSQAMIEKPIKCNNQQHNKPDMA